MKIELVKIDDYKWKIPKTGNMRVDGIIYGNEKIIKLLENDESPKQVANVACLPGIVKYSLAMPDIHYGYGFPIGGVAAFDLEEGVVSPGGVGYDINCGVRLMKTSLFLKDVEKKINTIIEFLFKEVPTGVGSEGSIHLSPSDLRAVMREGARWAVKNGYGHEENLSRIEDNGCIEGADPSAVSERAMERGQDQLGTAGSGNHFLEIGYVEKIFNKKAAEIMGLEENMITLLIHSGSRGFGHQICDDYLVKMNRYVTEKKISLPDRQLACAHIKSSVGQEYIAAMKCAVNFAFANRECLAFWAEKAIAKALLTSPSTIGMKLVYDVAHNVAKIEEHEVDGKKVKLCVHRKGATRGFPAGHPLVPEVYREIGQPVIIPGDMGRYSYVLIGTEKALKETWGTVCHGAGRVLSRKQAIKSAKGRSITDELMKRGIIVKAKEKDTLAEEMSEAYKDVEIVVDAVVQAGLSEKVARIRPIGVIKG
jgi:tRNA-splicing ligase RtcB